MRDAIQTFGAFLWGAVCMLLAMTCEATGQVYLYTGHWLMRQSERLSEHALRIGVWD